LTTSQFAKDIVGAYVAMSLEENHKAICISPFVDLNDAVMDIRLDVVFINVILGERVECFPLLNAGLSSADHNLPGPERPCRIQV
jgi:hypothetical protein